MSTPSFGRNGRRRGQRVIMQHAAHGTKRRTILAVIGNHGPAGVAGGHGQPGFIGHRPAIAWPETGGAAGVAAESAGAGGTLATGCSVGSAGTVAAGGVATEGTGTAA